MRAESGAAVVIDTNVWLSALLSTSGACALLIRHVIRYGQPVFSPDTYAELETRVWRAKFDRYLHMHVRKQFLHDVNAIALWVTVPEELALRHFSHDADDDKFIHAALAADTTLLVTGDQDLLVLHETLLSHGIRILSPADALRLPEFTQER